MELGVAVLVILLMLVANGVFAAYEMALAAMSQARLEVLRQEGAKGAAAALFMKQRTEASLAVVQLGITLAGVIAAATGGAGMDEFVAPFLADTLTVSPGIADFLALLIFVIPLSGLTIVFAELVPKTFALRNQEQVLLRLSPAMKVLYYAAYPIIKVLEGSVKWALQRSPGRFAQNEPAAASLRELHAITTLARATRLIGPLEERIVHSAVRLSKQRVTEIMLPPANLAVIQESASLAEALVFAHLHMHTRYPVWRNEGVPDSICGYITFKDIVSALAVNPAAPEVRGIVRAILRLPATLSLAKALETMIQAKEHIALAVNAAGATVGFLTLEDIMEELVGQIDDEYDRLSNHVHVLPSGWIMGGGVPMQQVFRLLQTPVPAACAADPAGLLDDWCHRQKQAPVQSADLIRADGIEVRVRKIRRQKVAEAVVRPAVPAEPVRPPSGSA